MIQRMIDAQNKKMMDLVNQSVKNGVDIEDYEDDFKQISEQIAQLEQRITALRESETDAHEYEHRLQTIQTTISNRAAHCDEYDDTIVRQMVECIRFIKAER